MDTPEKNTSSRYSEEDLAEFQALINNKIKQATDQINQLEEQMMELNESLQTSGADLGDNSAYTDVEFLKSMIFRQQKYLRELENALLRIKNKNYGICTLTGNLIDKKRLLAVPTTTKSLQAKTDAQKIAARSERRRPLVSDRPRQFTKVIKKPSDKKSKASFKPKGTGYDENAKINYDENAKPADLDNMEDS